MGKFVVIERVPNREAELRFGGVDFHNELVQSGEKCIGGGMFEIRDTDRVVVMWDTSFDFGAPKFCEVNIVDSFACEEWEDYRFYYVGDPLMPLREEYEVNVRLEEL